LRGLERFEGMELERLRFRELRELAGKWIAVEVWDRVRQPGRRIVVVGETAGDCLRRLGEKGLGVEEFELRVVGR
jgi:hypothetical protein